MFATKQRLLSSESDISLEIYPDKEEKLPELPKVSRDLWIEIVDYCRTSEAMRLGEALGTGGNSLLKSYVSSDDNLMMHGYFPLSESNISAFKTKIHQIPRSETKRKCFIFSAISCISLVGFGGTAAFICTGNAISQPADLLYQNIEIYYNETKQKNPAFSYENSTCTIVQDYPCREPICPTYDCASYDSFVLNCKEPSGFITRYTQSLFWKWSLYSPYLFDKYSRACEEIARINHDARPYYWGGIGSLVLTSILFIVLCNVFKKSSLTKPFSEIYDSWSEQEKLAYGSLVLYLQTEGLTLKDVNQKIQHLQIPSVEYNNCLFFKKRTQRKNTQIENSNQSTMSIVPVCLPGQS